MKAQMFDTSEKGRDTLLLTGIWGCRLQVPLSSLIHVTENPRALTPSLQMYKGHGELNVTFLCSVLELVHTFAIYSAPIPVFHWTEFNHMITPNCK